MKLLVYSLILLVLLSATIYAINCPATSPEGKNMLDEYDTCVLENAGDPIVGDTIKINCVHKSKNTGWGETPLKGARLTITGYNDHDEPIDGASLMLSNDGTKEFTPQISGTYLVQISSCDPPYSATFEVGENPDLIEGGVEDVEDDVGPSGAVVTGDVGTAGDAGETETVKDTEDVEQGPVADTSEESSNVLGFILEGKGTQEESKEASHFMVFLVGLIFS